MPTAAKTVGVVAQRASDFVEMRRVAEALAERGYRIVFFYSSPHVDLLSDDVPPRLEEMHRRGVVTKVEIIEPPRPRRKRAAKAPPLPRRPPTKPVGHRRSIRILVLQQVLRARNLVFRLWRPLLELASLCRRASFILGLYLQYQRMFNDLLRNDGVHVLILPEDVVGLVTPLAIRAGHRKNIPSIVLPYTIANQEEAFQGLRNIPTYSLSVPANRIVGLLFPRWAMRRPEAALLRLPAPYVLGHYLTRTSPPDPWMLNSGFANCICVENEAMRAYYLAGGLPPTKLRVVGAIYDDHLARYLGSKPAELEILRQELGVAGSKPLLVVGGCPDQTSSCPAFEFEDMAAFIAWLADSLMPMRQHYEIVVRPHPNYPEMGDRLAELGLRSTTIDTSRLVALADLYVAFASATIRWAIACGVPTVNYDVFQYNYDDFRQVRGVHTVRAATEFRDVLTSLVPGSQAYQTHKHAIDQEKARWGWLDGRSTDRIVAVIEELCALRKVPRTSS